MTIAMGQGIDGPDSSSFEQTLRRFGEEVVRGNLATGYDLQAQDFLRLRIERIQDAASVIVTVTESGEVFLLALANVYQTQRTAYDDQSKREALDDLLLIADSFLKREYEEEFRERRGRLVGRSIRFPNLNDLSISTPRGLGALAQRLFGYTTRLTKPE
ncbi:hypothetical protein EFE23_17455 [Micromonospora solifontis]|uniref:Uncharacterized protein n=2 Tax=Micromonosporaceae TaxID=28056 RepID=A0ABX9WDB0_9ACTN|nr:hypothetical protein EFE23_17455 [Micromonospora solifontis]